MKIMEVSPLFKGRLPFRWDANDGVPAVAGCYILATAFDDVLYIGQTNNLRRRMAEHLRSDRMVLPSDAGRAWWFYYALMPASKVVECEQGLLVNHRLADGCWPVLNRCGP